MKQCRSLRRAIHRGHAVNLYNGTYKSKKENTVMRQMWLAALRKQKEQLLTEESDENQNN